MAKYANYTKRPGLQPALGVQTNGKLGKCSYEPNCFSSSGDEAHLLRPWKPTAGGDAMDDLMEAINSYPPGQGGIDRGGFTIVTARADYLYVQFESLKWGFLDDVEFAIRGGEVQVRSASRLGFLDLGVNAKRLNWISARLRDKGWTAPKITKDEYPDYFAAREFTNDDYIASVLDPVGCPSIAGFGCN